MCITLLLLLISCDSSNITNEITDKGDQEISQIDGKPILQVQASQLQNSRILAGLRDRLAAKHGSAIVKALNRSDQQVDQIIQASKLNSAVQRKGDAPEIGSTHFRVVGPDGETEDFVLSLRRYHHNPAKVVQKGTSQLKVSTTYLALSPDRFYLEDDANGKEQWPVTFPAVSMDDPSNEIEVTFDKNGFVSSSLVSGSKAKTTSGESAPDLVFAEGTPVVTPNDMVDPCELDPESCDGGGGGGSGSGPFCTEVGGRGGATGGSTSGTQTYFTVNNIRMYATGDGDGHSELQMFVKQDDVYDGECFPRSYKYRFDLIADESTPQIIGADGGEYEVPDVNLEDVDYDEFWRNNEKVGRFPLFNLTDEQGPWRLTLVDDDKDYPDLSQRRNSDPLVTDVWTFDMSDGNWDNTKTGFSSDSHQYGSSDDPILESGVRRITELHANDRGGYFEFSATKSHTGGYFSYTFSLWDD